MYEGAFYLTLECWSEPSEGSGSRALPMHIKVQAMCMAEAVQTRKVNNTAHVSFKDQGVLAEVKGV